MTQKVYLVAITHKHGANHHVCATEEIANLVRQGYVAENADNEDWEGKERPTDPQELADAYFENQWEWHGMGTPEQCEIVELDVLTVYPEGGEGLF